MENWDAPIRAEVSLALPDLRSAETAGQHQGHYHAEQHLIEPAKRIALK